MSKHLLSIYGSHDASICIRPTKDTYRIYELERLTRVRNYSLNADPDFIQHLRTVKNLIAEEYGITDYSSCFYAQVTDRVKEGLKEVFGFNHFEEMSHHAGHAACGLYQSPFEEDCLIVSHDSGGLEVNEAAVATFCVYYANKKNGIKKIGTIPLDICSPYTIIAMPISEIHKTDRYSKFLTYAGKIMGLSAYGKVREEWVPHFEEFYYKVATPEALKLLGDKIGLDFSGINTIKGQVSSDIAATSQRVFEDLMARAIQPFLIRYNMPIILTGGGALNVLMNQQFVLTHMPIFVPCNPNDAGLSLGFMLMRNPPENQISVQYNGFGLLDKDILPEYINKYSAKEVDFKELARLISKGNIIGIVRGNSEVGARSLGNRSIICDPSKKNMKDKLNKIKNREFFRPFAPVCKKEDVETYFEFKGESPFMSFAPLVKEKYLKKIPAIVHNDSTARVQTVTKEQNEFLYNLIDAVETITEVGVVINTSFNIKGQPILTRIEDALHVLETTELDYVYIEGYLFEKK